MLNKELNIDIIAIFWPPRQWKTLLATYISYQRLERIYGNIDIKFNWVSISKRIKKTEELLNFENTNTAWLTIIDEIWMNYNSKDAVTKKNKMFSKYIFLSWKWNLSTIWIAQRRMSIPVDFRDNTTLIYECKKIIRPNKHPIFEVIRYEQKKDWELEEIHRKRIDLITWLKLLWLSYDTHETSEIE